MTIYICISLDIYTHIYIHGPNARPRSVMCGSTPLREIKEKAPWRKNYGGGMMEDKSWRRAHAGGIVEEETDPGQEISLGSDPKSKTTHANGAANTSGLTPMK